MSPLDTIVEKNVKPPCTSDGLGSARIYFSKKGPEDTNITNDARKDWTFYLHPPRASVFSNERTIQLFGLVQPQTKPESKILQNPIVLHQNTSSVRWATFFPNSTHSIVWTCLHFTLQGSRKEKGKRKKEIRKMRRGRGKIKEEKQIRTRPGVQQCQAQGLVFCPWLGSI